MKYLVIWLFYINVFSSLSKGTFTSEKLSVLTSKINVLLIMKSNTTSCCSHSCYVDMILISLNQGIVCTYYFPSCKELNSDLWTIILCLQKRGDVASLNRPGNCCYIGVYSGCWLSGIIVNKQSVQLYQYCSLIQVFLTYALPSPPSNLKKLS